MASGLLPPLWAIGAPLRARGTWSCGNTGADRQRQGTCPRPGEESDLAALEQAHVTTADVALLGHVCKKLEEYNEFAQDEVTHLGKYAVATVYGEGERPSAVLAALL
ncbi:hypothetical protein NDU88_005101 [Pleurodeles waltl]|uniref:Uncharacterized protein n=1 Tax=Pleurodeles waltl TaxID=8319 RepID=A0AAV7SKP0_PLEWA|nr:hypothetical protein NDU88_005101 [Pleurodeles waltl]